MYRDRRVYCPAPDLNGPITHNTLPMKICLILAAVMMCLFAGFLWFTGAAVLYIRYWVYIAAAALIILLLAGAGCFAIHNRMNTERSRRTTAIILSGVMLMLGMTAFAICSAFASLMQPIGFFDSPQGENRIVVLRSQTEEGDLIEAYPAIGDHFYVAAITSESVISNGVIQGVEWEGERLAKLLLEDAEGNDTVITVDFSLLYAGEDAAE